MRTTKLRRFVLAFCWTIIVCTVLHKLAVFSQRSLKNYKTESSCIQTLVGLGFEREFITQGNGTCSYERKFGEK